MNERKFLKEFLYSNLNAILKLIYKTTNFIDI